MKDHDHTKKSDYFFDFSKKDKLDHDPIHKEISKEDNL
jgi:hypothetical protein